MKFNKRLAKLESVYLNKSSSRKADPLDIADFIEHVFENSDSYKIPKISKNLFEAKCINSPKTAISIVKNVLLEQGDNVSFSSIEDGIEVYKSLYLLGTDSESQTDE